MKILEPAGVAFKDSETLVAIEIFHGGKILYIYIRKISHRSFLQMRQLLYRQLWN